MRAALWLRTPLIACTLRAKIKNRGRVESFRTRPDGLQSMALPLTKDIHLGAVCSERESYI